MEAALAGLAPEPPAPAVAVLVGSVPAVSAFAVSVLVESVLDFALSELEVGQADPGAAAVLAELFAAFQEGSKLQWMHITLGYRGALGKSYLTKILPASAVATRFVSGAPSSSVEILPVVGGPFAAFELVFGHPLELGFAAVPEQDE